MTLFLQRLCADLALGISCSPLRERFRDCVVSPLARCGDVGCRLAGIHLGTEAEREALYLTVSSALTNAMR